ncbi:hypothetical protein WN51_06776, partial [Melipona quadrifasciata]
RNKISIQQYTNFFKSLGNKFIAGGNYNAKHFLCNNSTNWDNFKEYIEKKNPTNPLTSSYRPISLLPIMSKEVIVWMTVSSGRNAWGNLGNYIYDSVLKTARSACEEWRTEQCSVGKNKRASEECRAEEKSIASSKECGVIA